MSLRFVFLCVLVVGVSVILLPSALWPGHVVASTSEMQCYWTKRVFRDFWNAGSFRFDHPEPNFVILPHVAEFYSTLTTIPFAGTLLLYNALRQDMDAILVFLFVHVCVMYCGAFFSHMTLIAPLFSFTVSAVIANSLHAYFWWGGLLLAPVLGGLLKRFDRLLSWGGLVVGLMVGIGAILTVQHLPQLEPVGGFYTLVIVQPPFVFLALCAVTYLYHWCNPSDPGYRCLFWGACLLMTAMCVSAVETFIDPVMIGDFPLLHIIIHTLEQVGIYMYGTGTAWIHYRYLCGRDDVAFANEGGFIPYVKLLHTEAVVAVEKVQLSAEQNEKGMSATKVTGGRRRSRSSGAPTRTLTEIKAGVRFDLLDRYPRQNPHAFNHRLLEAHYGPGTHPCPVLRERNCWAVCDPMDIRGVLKDSEAAASNPYPDERLIGLSTTDGDRHTVQRKLAASFFSKSKLRHDKLAFAAIAQHMTKVFVAQDGHDLVSQWGYRIAVASGLYAIGLPMSTVLNVPYVDKLGAWSLAMVKLVAPVGGLGPRHGVKISELCSWAVNVGRSVLPTLRMVATVGPSCAWSILRPDLNMAPVQEGAPRTGMFVHSDCIPEVPAYFTHVHGMWEATALSQPDSFLAALYAAHSAGSISRAEAMLLIVQCLVSMTTANALVNACVDMLALPMNRHVQLQRSESEMAAFVSECLWRTPPLQRLPRRLRSEMTLPQSRQVCPAGSHLILMLGAANAASEMGAGTRATDIGAGTGKRNATPTRRRSRSRSGSRATQGVATEREADNDSAEQQKYRKSLTFGAGKHRCLGEELVKLEMQVGLKAWLDIAPPVRANSNSCTHERLWQVDVGNYGFTSYEVKFE